MTAFVCRYGRAFVFDATAMLPLMCVSSCAWQAFPAFNKRYAFVDGALEKGTLLVLEVEAHYPTAQFGGAK